MFSLLVNIIIVRVADLLGVGERFYAPVFGGEHWWRIVHFTDNVWFCDQGCTMRDWWHIMRPPRYDDCPF